ncbi:FAD-binding oxidoreductase [Providencia huaxiensis]|uniref:NAD(P)/FAD-dependent oxidoreductase n=1 Tax=Providencia TaxID=586 RepID=UPI00140A27C1|nr:MULTISPECIES: FAD-binding oxidoreductase [Providencia]MBN6361446.1 FAD-binding oxidoreductase [Providencia huaxiensis]MBQ0533839.1 FAD-binding oxidoreductase [Providencia huaxiensis]MBQ0588533.1 FAD-binding oxidoreductase [Providencia huaxiensis]MCD2527809.1 FAD-binding oxidoreductase [Providencia huaxiensis]MCG9534981.1 FAD-binding oxidoreductase [Providencia huaxiensis]
MDPTHKKNIIIIGAGFVGTTLAWYLSKQSDKQVILLDKAHAGQGVTQHAFAWLNVSYGRPDAYSQLRQQALVAWHELDEHTDGKLNIQWTGALSWQETDSATAEYVYHHQQSGFNVELLDKSTVHKMEPCLSVLPELAAFCPDEGSVDPIHATKTLLSFAIEQGVIYLPEQEVQAILQEGGRIIGVKTQTDTFLAEQVIVTAGTDATALMQSLHVELPVIASPSIIVHINGSTEQTLVQHIISTPQMELRPAGSGKILCAEDYISEKPEHNAVAIAQNALTTIKNSFIGSHTLNLENAFIGMRPMPKDEMPIVGKVADFEGLYIISMHAAITLAPLICQLAQDEILHGIEQAALGPYRLTRFVSGN